MKGDDFMEVVADPKTRAIAKAEKITDADDLKEATEQKAAMARAKVPLLAAPDKAVSANGGSRAVSIVPELRNGLATPEMTLLTGNAFKKISRSWIELVAHRADFQHVIAELIILKLSNSHDMFRD